VRGIEVADIATKLRNQRTFYPVGSQEKYRYQSPEGNIGPHLILAVSKGELSLNEGRLG